MEPTEIRLLPVPLTPEEWEDRALLCARMSDQISEREKQVTQAKESAKITVKNAEAHCESLKLEQRQLAHVVETRKETRSVLCRIVLSRAERKKRIYRTDTGDKVLEVPISEDEVSLGAEWIKDYKAGVKHLIHPDEPELKLKTVALEDHEKQLPVPGTDEKSSDPAPKGKTKGQKSEART